MHVVLCHRAKSPPDFSIRCLMPVGIVVFKEGIPSLDIVLIVTIHTIHGWVIGEPDRARELDGSGFASLPTQEMLSLELGQMVTDPAGGGQENSLSYISDAGADPIVLGLVGSDGSQDGLLSICHSGHPGASAPQHLWQLS